MKPGEFVSRFLTVRRCVCCGEITDYENRDDAFCPECRKAWEKAKMKECPECHLPAVECACMPDMMSSAGVALLGRLTEYKSTSADEAQNKIIYFVKRNRNKRVFSFLASQLAPRVSEMLAQTDTGRENAVITYVPRSVRAGIKYGFDQSEMICRELSEISGIPCITAIRRRSGREQKKMKAQSRKKNASHAFVADSRLTESDIKGKYVILFDDVVTTGSSMSACADIIMERHPALIAGLCIARTEKNSKKNPV